MKSHLYARYLFAYVCTAEKLCVSMGSGRNRNSVSCMLWSVGSGGLGSKYVNGANGGKIGVTVCFAVHEL